MTLVSKSVTAAASKPIEFSFHGRRIAGVCWGDPSLPPMLAVHGWLDNAGSFSELAPRLADRHHIVAIDFAGHGLSDRLVAGAWYHYVDYLTDITAVVEHLGWQQLDLLGHSMGGTLAVLWAAAFPDRVKRVISIDALGPISDDASNTAKRLTDALTDRQQWQPGSSGARVYSNRDDALASRARNDVMSSASADALATRGLEAVAGGYRWRVDRRHRLNSLTRYTEEQVLAALSACVAPVLFIRAKDSHFKMPSQVVEQRLLAFSNAVEDALPGGHHLHLDDAASVIESIDRFLN